MVTMNNAAHIPDIGQDMGVGDRDFDPADVIDALESLRACARSLEQSVRALSVQSRETESRSGEDWAVEADRIKRELDRLTRTRRGDHVQETPANGPTRRASATGDRSAALKKILLVALEELV